MARLRTVIDSFLKVYRESDRVTRERARHHLYLLVLITLAIALYLLKIIISEYTDRFNVTLLSASLPVMLLMLFFLKAGYRLFSAHVMLITSFLLIWADMLFQNYPDVINRLDNITLVPGVIAGAALLTGRRGTIFYAVLNLLMLLYVRFYSVEAFGIAEDTLNNYFMDGLFGIGVVSTSSYLYSMISARAHSELRELNEHLEEKVNDRTERLTDAFSELNQKNKQIERSYYYMQLDRKLAVNVQRQFLVTPYPDFEQWDIGTFYEPMEQISGDFYDIYHENNELLGIGFFDVSGHGVASALITMLAKKTIYRSFSEHKTKRIDRIIVDANAELLDDIGDIDHHLSGILLRVKDDNYIEFVNAGHPAILKKSSDGEVSVIADEDFNNHGPLLGIHNLTAGFKTFSFKMNRGDSFLLFSDGLSEAIGGIEENVLYTNMIRIFREAEGEDSEAVLAGIIRRVRSEMKDACFDDDVSAVLVTHR